MSRSPCCSQPATRTWTFSRNTASTPARHCSAAACCALRRPTPWRAAIWSGRGRRRPSPHYRLSCWIAGRRRFAIFCSPCHGAGGDGDGIIVHRGMPHPTSYHVDRLVTADDQHFFDVITNGYGAMYSYAARVGPQDRWAIVAYIRALQLSRRASIEDVPPDERAKLTGQP
ncbi:c-type cytochrome [Bradyrhizobium sp. USDA 3364]